MRLWKHFADCPHQFAPVDACGCETRRLEQAVDILQDVMEGTRIDKSGNRSDDGILFSRMMDRAKGTRVEDDRRIADYRELMAAIDE